MHALRPLHLISCKIINSPIKLFPLLIHSRGPEMTGQLRLYGKYEQLRFCTLDDRSIVLKGKHVVDKYVNKAAISMFLSSLLFLV